VDHGRRKATRFRTRKLKHSEASGSENGVGAWCPILILYGCFRCDMPRSGYHPKVLFLSGLRVGEGRKLIGA
jgi:hypothetical protein